MNSPSNSSDKFRYERPIDDPDLGPRFEIPEGHFIDEHRLAESESAATAKL